MKTINLEPIKILPDSNPFGVKNAEKQEKVKISMPTVDLEEEYPTFDNGAKQEEKQTQDTQVNFTEPNSQEADED